MKYRSFGPEQRRSQGPAPLSVGHRAYVNRTPAYMPGLDAVSLTNKDDTAMLEALSDGQEVEILAWRQRPRVRYHVRCISDGATGWVWGEFLRPTREPLPEPAPEPGPRAADRKPRWTALRLQAKRTPASAGPLSTPPEAAEPARDVRPVPCPICRKVVHPYNLSRNSKGVVVGCYVCQRTL